MKHTPLHVLWIEDSADDVDLFSIAARRAQVTIKLEVKTDGQEGIDHLMALDAGTARWPDLILLDLNLPKRHGREVLTEIKGNERLKPIPVVILTTSVAETDIVSSYRLGAACYLVKPDRLEQLVELIKRFCTFWEQVEVAPGK